MYCGRGISQFGVRWKTVVWAAASATWGMNCIALQPVPITPTRLPVRSRSWFHLAECHEGPANDSRPGIVGSWGRFSWPTAETTALATIVSSPSGPLTSRVQVLVPSSHTTEETSVEKRMSSRIPKWSTQASKYSSRSDWAEWYCGQSCFCMNE